MSGYHQPMYSTRRLAAMILLGGLGLALSGCMPGTPLISTTGPADPVPRTAPETPTLAYAWSPVPDGLSNVLPMHWLRLDKDTDLQALAQATKIALDAMPNGHRVLIIGALHTTLSHHPKDRLVDGLGNTPHCFRSDGSAVPYQSLWWDHGVAEVARLLDAFFSHYAAIGGRLDVAVLDFEAGLTLWALHRTARQRYGCGILHLLDAIARDPRIAAIQHELGFRDLRPIAYWNTNDSYLRWDGLMRARVNDYVNRAYYAPLKRHYPAVKMSNYGDYYQARHFQIPNRYGQAKHRHYDGAHVGTHQARSFYGWLEIVPALEFDTLGVTESPFSALRYDVNKMRAMKLSSTVPIYPWVSNKEFADSDLRTTDLYQELIFHIGLSGVENFLFFNPDTTDTPATPTSNRLLSHSLQELDRYIGHPDRVARIPAAIDWHSDYLLSEMRVKGRSVWRFTPDLRADQSIADVLVAAYPATFQLGTTLLVIENGRVQANADSVSRAGYWILETARSP